MERDDIITRIRKELDDLQETIDKDSSISDERRSSLATAVTGLREQLDSNGPEDTDELDELASLFGLSMESIDAIEDPAKTGTWREIRRIMTEEMELKNILYSDSEDDYVTAQFGMGDGEGRKLVMRVMLIPDAHCVQIRAGYPFDIDRRVLPIARMFICQRNYEMRYTRIEVDARDGEVYVCVVLRSEDFSAAPMGFETMLHLAISVGFDEYDALRRYSRAEFTDEERTAFLEEVERISPLMLEDSEGK